MSDGRSLPLSGLYSFSLTKGLQWCTAHQILKAAKPSSDSGQDFLFIHFVFLIHFRHPVVVSFGIEKKWNRIQVIVIIAGIGIGKLMLMEARRQLRTSNSESARRHRLPNLHSLAQHRVQYLLPVISQLFHALLNSLCVAANGNERQ